MLVTDWMTDEWDDERVLREHRQQQMIEGHTGFRWLKGPAAVAPVFLKTPPRIRAMKAESSLTPEMAFEHFAGVMGRVISLGTSRRAVGRRCKRYPNARSP